VEPGRAALYIVVVVSVLFAESLPIDVVDATLPIVGVPLDGAVVVNEVSEVTDAGNKPDPVTLMEAVSAAEF